MAHVRIPITNIYTGNDYTGRILMGPEEMPLNVILDTGSSALAIDGKKYALTASDKTTRLAQTDAYGDGSSWTGAVIRTSVSVGSHSRRVTLAGANAALAYEASSDMFPNIDGILGLAYAPLDDAFRMPLDTWQHKYTASQVRGGEDDELTPYLIQLKKSGLATEKISFVTWRSAMHASKDAAENPLNHGWMILGDAEECTELYTGAFQSAKVLSDDWYSTNLKAIIVGETEPVYARLHGPKGFSTNSIIDSGTSTLDISPQMLKAVISRFLPHQQRHLEQSIYHEKSVPMSRLNLAEWPTIRFVLEGEHNQDVLLDVAPHNYWQVNAGRPGSAQAAISKGDPGLIILGLPAMNGYFTVYDGTANRGKGAVRFAKARR
jgi:hypothetical protein